jgi:L-seryl-tRNA(Ser) seleniumtransferase
MSPTTKQDLLRQLPAVEALLQHPAIKALLSYQPRWAVVEAVRETLAAVRQQMLADSVKGDADDKSAGAGFKPAPIMDYLLQEIGKLTEQKVKYNLRRVINATGVVLHTNLGRAVLAPQALARLAEVGGHYSTLEYNLAAGRRGSRQELVEELCCRLTGAQAALVVNNNAAAVLLALSTLACGKEVVVSRGQLVEIGGSFRIPEVMQAGGAFLREVGTTNKTHPSDYEKAIGDNTALLLKVHTSNYRILGFTAEAALSELVEIGRRFNLPVMEDLGSGALVDLSAYGLPKEPLVQETLQEGADVVTFSGDKLLGGPQAGIIVGKRAYIAPMRKNPLARAVRVDKFTLAALEATLRLYLEEDHRKIPTLRMITATPEELQAKAQRLLEQVKAPAHLTAAIKEEYSEVGGGALPLAQLKTSVLVLVSREYSAQELEQKLRAASPPVIARIEQEQVFLDLRTILEEELEEVGRILGQI